MNSMQEIFDYSTIFLILFFRLSNILNITNLMNGKITEITEKNNICICSFSIHTHTTYSIIVHGCWIVHISTSRCHLRQIFISLSYYTIALALEIVLKAYCPFIKYILKAEICNIPRQTFFIQIDDNNKTTENYFVLLAAKNDWIVMKMGQKGKILLQCDWQTNFLSCFRDHLDHTNNEKAIMNKNLIGKKNKT